LLNLGLFRFGWLFWWRGRFRLFRLRRGRFSLSRLGLFGL